jgi:hypothetical protein
LIYLPSAVSDPIRQGDIFSGVPRLDVSLGKVVVADDGNLTEQKWEVLAQQRKPITILAAARPVKAIVVSQDCDALRAPDITLCEIRLFQDVERKSKDTKAPKAWKNILTQHARVNQKWFYLPPDPSIGITEKMGVDFLVTLRVLRADLEQLRSQRIARLNDIAEAHFRERIAEFFRRYAYDEWYCLDESEMESYMSEYPDVRPFPWQKTP